MRPPPAGAWASATGDWTLAEWNKAFAYIADAEHEKASAKATAALISCLAAGAGKKDR